MQTKTKLASVLVAAATAVGGGTAIAATGGGKHKQTTKSSITTRGPVRGAASLSAAATYLGLTADALRTQLDAGKTLADVATAQGKSVSGLEDALLAELKTNLDAAVTAGKLTADQETTILTDAKTRIATMVTSTLPKPAGADLMNAAATYLGLTGGALRTQLDGGKSLADVATAQGKTVDGLKAALTAAFSSSLDTFVNAKHVAGSGGPGFSVGSRGPGGPGGLGFFGHR